MLHLGFRHRHRRIFNIEDVSGFDRGFFVWLGHGDLSVNNSRIAVLRRERRAGSPPIITEELDFEQPAQGRHSQAANATRDVSSTGIIEGFVPPPTLLLWLLRNLNVSSYFEQAMRDCAQKGNLTQSEGRLCR
jgi:hypothetical protein